MAKETPAWTIPYGKEFWGRRTADGTAGHNAGDGGVSVPPSLDLGAVMERVSHAITFEGGEGAGGQPVNWKARLAAKAYTAVFDEAGVRFYVFHPIETTDSSKGVPTSIGRHTAAEFTEAVFSTTSIRSAGRDLRKEGAAGRRWSILGNTLQALVDPASGLVEHFETGSKGVAVTWIIPKALANSGPLEIEARIAGLQYSERTELGHHFADTSGTARLRIGNVTAVDAKGSSWDLSSRVEGDRLKVTVSEAILGCATYPLAIDPLIGPEFGMDNPLFDPTSPTQSAPAVASNGTEFLVVWADDRFTAGPSGIAIYGARVSSSGEVLDPDGFLIAWKGYNTEPTVASNGNDFMVAWVSQTQDIVSINGARITAAGEVLDRDGFTVAPGQGQRQRAPDIESNGVDYLIVWAENRVEGTYDDIRAARVTRDGTVLDSSPSPLTICEVRGVQTAPALTGHGTNYFVVWLDGRTGRYELYGTQVKSSGEVANPNGKLLSKAAGGGSSPAVASNGRSAFVIWPDANANIYGLRVDENSNVLDTAPIAINTTPGNKLVVKLRSVGSDYLAVWSQFSIQDGRFSVKPVLRGTRITEEGAVVTLLGTELHGEANISGSPVLASAGRTCLLVWPISENPNFYSANQLGGEAGNLRGIIVDETGASGRPISIPARTGANQQVAPIVAYNGTNHLVVWQDSRETQYSVGYSFPTHPLYGARVSPQGEVRDPNGIRISNSVFLYQTAALASNNRDFLVAWSTNRGDAGSDIVGVRIDGTGKLLDSVPLRITGTDGYSGVPAVGSNGADYFVVWTHSSVGGLYSLRGTSVTGEGVIKNPNGLLIAALSRTAVAQIASDGKDYLLVWESSTGRWYDSTNYTDILAFRVSESGAAMDTAPRRIFRKDKYVPYYNTDGLFPRVASNGESYLVVWQDPNATSSLFGVPDTHGTGVLLNAAGVPATSNPIQLSDFPSNQRKPRVASDGSDYLVVWEDNRNSAVSGVDVYGVMLGGDGTKLTRLDFSVNSRSYDQTALDAAGQGFGRYLVVSQSFRDEAYRVAGTFVSREPISFVNGKVVLYWPARRGTKYRVQFASDIASPRWIDLPGDVNATSDAAAKIDETLSGTSQRFYRVIEVP